MAVSLIQADLFKLIFLYACMCKNLDFGFPENSAREEEAQDLPCSKCGLCDQPEWVCYSYNLIKMTHEVDVSISVANVWDRHEKL